MPKEKPIYAVGAFTESSDSPTKKMGELLNKMRKNGYVPLEFMCVSGEDDARIEYTIVFVLQQCHPLEALVYASGALVAALAFVPLAQEKGGP